jgi:hypothetical protein
MPLKATRSFLNKDTFFPLFSADARGMDSGVWDLFEELKHGNAQV